MRAAACQKALVPFELLASLSRPRMGSSITRNYVQKRRRGKMSRGTVAAGRRLAGERRRYAKFLERRHRSDRRPRGSARRGWGAGSRAIRRAARRVFGGGGGRGGARRPRRRQRRRAAAGAAAGPAGGRAARPRGGGRLRARRVPLEQKARAP